MRRALAAFLVLALAGCGSPPPANLPVDARPHARRGGGAALTITVAPSAYTLKAIVRRWLATDIYEYAVVFKRWDGSAYTDFVPPLTVVLPQKDGAPKTQAVFTNLKQGEKYRAELQIRGNAGGTAPTEVLNASTAATAVFDFTADQDVPEVMAATLSGTLDPVPFAGVAHVSVSSLPPGTSDFTAALEDVASGTTLTTVSYPVSQQATFSNLKAGPSYRIVLTAKQAGETLQTITSTSFTWDSGDGSLETDRTITMAF